ncbi:MAG: TetR/AcrR family transcriptional regulator, partial [Candidatus Methylacidiphilales bacterium]
MKTLISSPTVGRPRSFCMVSALDRAMEVFWQKGYEGASLTDLTQAMGINRPSLYAAYGNKEELFRKALQRYAERMTCYVRDALTAPTARESVLGLLHASVNLLTDPGNPRGCLAVQGALACGDEALVIRQELVAWRAAGQCALRKRLEQAQIDGDLPVTESPEDLARYVYTLAQGMSVQSIAGASRDELLRVVETAMRGWP